MSEYLTLVKLKNKAGLYQIDGFTYEGMYDRLIPEDTDTAYEVEKQVSVRRDSDLYDFITYNNKPRNIVARVRIYPIKED